MAGRMGPMDHLARLYFEGTPFVLQWTSLSRLDRCCDPDACDTTKTKHKSMQKKNLKRENVFPPLEESIMCDARKF